MADSPIRSRTVVSQIDGPYGWLITIAAFFAQGFTLGFGLTSGVYYEAFMEMFDESSGKTSLLATLSAAISFGLGPVTGLLINRFGHRSITLTGGLIAGAGLVLSSYATNIYFMGATFAVITGIGFGLAYLASVSIVPLYFDKWQSVALGITVSGVGIGMFIYPPLTRFLIDVYGVRGSLLIMGGITLNVCVCGCVMRPLRERNVATAAGEIKTRNDMTSKSETEHSRIKRVLDVLHINIFRNFGYVILCVNNFLCMVGTTVVYVHAAAYTEETGESKNVSAMVISAIGISNFIGRPLSGFLAKLPFRCCTSLILYSTGLTLCGIVAMILPTVSSLTFIMTCASSFGLLNATNATLTPKLIVEFLEVSLIPISYGYLLVFDAFGCLLGPPVAGYLYDSFHTYAISFYFAGAMLTSAGIVLLLPLASNKLSPKAVATSEDSDIAANNTTIKA